MHSPIDNQHSQYYLINDTIHQQKLKFNPVVCRLTEKSTALFGIFEGRRPLLQKSFFDERVLRAPGGLVADSKAVRYLHELNHFWHADIAELLNERLVHARLPIGEPPQLH